MLPVPGGQYMRKVWKLSPLTVYLFQSAGESSNNCPGLSFK
jgi:hypothetical protein